MSAKKKMIGVVAAAVVLASGFLVPAVAAGVPDYVVIRLEPGSSVANGGSGGLAGGNIRVDSGINHAAMWSIYPDAIDLNPSGFETSDVRGMSDTQQVGLGRNLGGDTRALLWSGSAASAVDLGAAEALGVADGRQVGGGYPPGIGDRHALLWSGTADSVVDLNPTGYSYSIARGIGDGQQVGNGNTAAGKTHALLWLGTAASCIDLNPAGFLGSTARGVSGGQQVGEGQLEGGSGDHALLWSGTAASFVDLHPSGWRETQAAAVCNSLQVGFGQEVSGGPEHALLWSGTAESVVDLHSYIPGQYDYNYSVASDVDASGNVYGYGKHESGSGTSALVWWRAGTMRFSSLRIERGGPVSDLLALNSAKSLDVAEGLTIVESARLELSGATVTAGQGVIVRSGASLAGSGLVNCRVTGEQLSTITAEGGDLTLGDASSYTGFATQGRLDVGSAHAVLRTKGFAPLGQLTTVGGGTLSAANGIAIGVGGNLVGEGVVEGRVAAAIGSTIEATGALSLGDAAAYDGFYSDGTMLTGGNTVTINDRNAAVLGSLTQLGDGTAGGTLTAGSANPGDTQAHFLLEQGKNMVGRGSVNGNFKNQGDVIGDGVGAGERIIFNSPWIVSGKGTFTNTLIMGTFAPGESPGITNGTNQGFGGTVQIELGGTVPGFGNGNHDQINDTAMILLVGSPTLEILPWNGFVPEVGDEFIILTWQAGLDGKFGDVVTASWLADHGISFALHYNNIGGAGNLTIEAVPEPATLSLLALGGLAMMRRKK